VAFLSEIGKKLPERTISYKAVERQKWPSEGKKDIVTHEKMADNNLCKRKKSRKNRLFPQ
jgi:hypothetical protein